MIFALRSRTSVQLHPISVRVLPEISIPRPLSVLLLLVAMTQRVLAADYAREERWAQEVVPAIVVGEAIYLATPARPKVLAILTLPRGAAKGAVVVVHGLGVHPDWGLAGELRSMLADAGFATLSVQMPVQDAAATRDDYRVTLPEAGERIAAAILYLRARGFAKVAIVSHSLGATMVNAYLARPDALSIAAWAPVGMFGQFAASASEPVLDVIAGRDLPEVLAAAPLRARNLPRDRCSQQLTIADTDHYFDHRQKELSAAVASFLGSAFAGRC
jgi:alpha/beta superfamily hydrolase